MTNDLRYDNSATTDDFDEFAFEDGLPQLVLVASFSPITNTESKLDRKGYDMKRFQAFNVSF
jgi:hypothetical protein